MTWRIISVEAKLQAKLHGECDSKVF